MPTVPSRELDHRELFEREIRADERRRLSAMMDTNLPPRGLVRISGCGGEFTISADSPDEHILDTVRRFANHVCERCVDIPSRGDRYE